MPSFFDINGDPTMDPYTILSLPPTATEAEIKKAYRMQMLQLHPDKLSPTLGDDSIAAVTEKFHNVKDAYEFLVNPMHLASRRLYMAKMASRRADYERREAFLRRNGGKGDDYTAYNARGGGISGYRSGGGGAAGMAGTGMPPPPQRPSAGHDGNANNNSYPVRPKKHRSKSDADFAREGRDDGHGRDHHRGGGPRRSSMGGNGMYKNVSRGRPGKGNGQHQASKRKYSNNKGGGYKSDTAANKAKSHSAREGRSNRPRNKHNERHERQRQRTRSEPRHRREKYESEGEKRTNNIKDNKRSNRTDYDREAAAARARSQRRQRAKSAPARSQTRSKNNKAATSIMKDRDLPRHFFCPLTKRLMKDPVMDTEGNTYDREAIERWLRVQNSSPITNGHLSLDMLKPDKQLKRAIYKATGEDNGP